MSLVFLLASSQLAHAVTYYVDSDRGKDTWSGTMPDPVASSAYGPWQSLFRVSRATLLPGDEIRLRCGGRWTETLRLPSSGTSAAPITVGAYPGPCSVRPTIDGTVTVPSHAWTLRQGSTYQASLPFNLIDNGALDTSTRAWSAWSPTLAAAISYVQACPGGVSGCLQLTGDPAAQSLVHSANFPVTTGVTYSLQFSVNVPAGAPFYAIVRRVGPTYEPIGVFQSYVGTGSWQSLSALFSPSGTAANARFDLYLPSGGGRVWLRGVSIAPVVNSVDHVVMNGRVLQPAHHPNFGFDSQNPGSLYLKNAVDSDRVATPSGFGSTYVTTGADLLLPPGGALTAGMGVRVRSENWSLDERKVVSVDGARLNLDSASTYQFRANWGYVLTGMPWMVDSPDEWAVDTSNSSLRLWMPDSAHPGGRVALGVLETGIDLTNRTNIVVDGLSVRGTGTGATLLRAANVTMRNVSIQDIRGDGIVVVASSNCVIEGNDLRRIGRDAVAGRGIGGDLPTGLRVSGNIVTDVAVQMAGGLIVSLPRTSFAAIHAGSGATVVGNRLQRTGVVGIRVTGSSSVTDNSIFEPCMVLGDCGAIYVTREAAGTQLRRNLIANVFGNTAVTPVRLTLLTGLYLDNNSTGMTVSDNTVANADYGILLHNATFNTIEGNTLYGNRLMQLWFQEDKAQYRAEGDIVGNSIVRNVFFPTSGGPSVVQESYLGTTSDFANYSGNIYSALLSPRIVSENWLTGSVLSSAGYTLPEWRAATDGGVPRLSDTTGRVVSPAGYASFRVVGPNIVPNGNLLAGRIGWTWWVPTTPTGKGSLSSCPVGSCLTLVGGASQTLLASPNFSIAQGQWYRVSFDAKTGEDATAVSVVVRRGGGGTASYEVLMPTNETFVAGTQWKRFSFAFKALKSVTANDPVTQELGARVDFFWIQPGKSLTVSNLEMVPLSPIEVGLKTAILTNPDVQSSASVQCPDATLNPSLCGQYVRFLDGLPIQWPYTLPALGKEMIYTRNQELLDSDGDGIADSQDACPATAVALGVNAVGCPIVIAPN